jgi:hypothetical protein
MLIVSVETVKEKALSSILAPFIVSSYASLLTYFPGKPYFPEEKNKTKKKIESEETRVK